MKLDVRVFSMKVPALLEVTEIPIEYVGLFLLIVLCVIFQILIDGNRD